MVERTGKPATGTWRCDECPKEFHSLGALRKHGSDIHGISPKDLWWGDEDVTVAKLQTLSLNQIHAMLLRPQLPSKTRLALFRIVASLKVVDSGAEAESRRAAEIRELIRSVE